MQAPGPDHPSDLKAIRDLLPKRLCSGLRRKKVQGPGWGSGFKGQGESVGTGDDGLQAEVERDGGPRFHRPTLHSCITPVPGNGVQSAGTKALAVHATPPHPKHHACHTGATRTSGPLAASAVSGWAKPGGRYMELYTSARRSTWGSGRPGGWVGGLWRITGMHRRGGTGGWSRWSAAPDRSPRRRKRRPPVSRQRAQTPGPFDPLPPNHPPLPSQGPRTRVHGSCRQ